MTGTWRTNCKGVQRLREEVKKITGDLVFKALLAVGVQWSRWMGGLRKHAAGLDFTVRANGGNGKGKEESRMCGQK